MHWTDTAIILGARKHGETSAVIRVFSRQHGVFAGIVKGANSKANRGVIQPGNIVSATWNARLSEHLGMFKCELLEANAALIMQDAARLAALTSACSVIEASLPERHPYPKLYVAFAQWLQRVRIQDSGFGKEEWIEEYVQLELLLLAESGFGLDLSCCAATGTTEDLVYVSPKSGRAVSAAAGEAYREKLLKLPAFLLPPPRPSPLQGEGEVRSSSRAALTENVATASPPPAGGRDREGEKRYCKPNRYGSHDIIPNARDLRRNMSEAEKQLWYHLRAHRFSDYSFRRQHPITAHYIVDFVCLDKKLVIEVDGGQHSEQVDYDTKRTAFLEQEGYRVLRFWNNEVLGNMDEVLMSILSVLEKPPSLALPREGAGEGKVSAGSKETLAGLRLTGYFLEHWLLGPHNRKLPAARGRLIETLKEHYGAEA